MIRFLFFRIPLHYYSSNPTRRYFFDVYFRSLVNILSPIETITLFVCLRVGLWLIRGVNGMLFDAQFVLHLFK